MFFQGFVGLVIFCPTGFLLVFYGFSVDFHGFLFFVVVFD